MPRITRLLSATALCLALGALGGCGENVKPVQPKVVHVPVEVPAVIPDELLKDCPIATPKEKSVEELVTVANARKGSLQDCNVDKKALRDINEDAKVKKAEAEAKVQK